MLMLTAMLGLVAVASYNDARIDLSSAAKHTGRVAEARVVEVESEDSGFDLEFLHLRVEGLDRPVRYRRVFSGYDDILARLKARPEVTVYYDPASSDPELALYQLETNGEVLVAKEEYEAKTIWLLVFVGGAFVFSICYIPIWIRDNFIRNR